MNGKLNILIIIVLFYFVSGDIGDWRKFPACIFGRLQSPIEIRENETIYANNFSFVYQSYKGSKPNKIDNNPNYNYATVFEVNDGGYINFERGGVIKQYELKRIEIYPGIHPIDGEYGDFELHLIHEKNLDFITNKNQYRSIQDANIYLVIVLRYKKNCGDIKCISDNGLFENKENDGFHLNNYAIFQDKRAYFYEGSLLHIPCDENVNYYVVNDFFYSPSGSTLSLEYERDSIHLSEKYGRPIYKNFMNYKEVLKSNFISSRIIISFLLLFILF